MDADVIVIGAGAAGLTAADDLSRAGLDVLVLEARPRPGGRVLTVRAPLPVELGAEFVHGRPAELWRRAGRLAEAGGEQWEDGRPAPGYWPGVESVLSGLRPGPHDASFDEAARGPRKDVERARAFVEGFNAADAARISARALLGQGDSSRNFRPLDGYDAVLPRPKARLVLGAPVLEVRWRRGAVDVDGRTARAAVVTLPLGVLKAGAVRFLPDPGKAAALAGLEMGSAKRVVLLFESPFWEERAEGVSFFHAPGAPFPVWWTQLPVRAPMLTGWSGGPRSLAASVDDALPSLRRALGFPVPRPLSVWHHDWDADPWSRGAYSYALAGHSGAHGELARPTVGTLFWAGEAADDTGDNGTVGGAMASGARAARQVLSAFGARRGSRRRR